MSKGGLRIAGDWLFRSSKAELAGKAAIKSFCLASRRNLVMPGEDRDFAFVAVVGQCFVYPAEALLVFG